MESGVHITAKCPLFACRECRTRTGWMHQPWCCISDNTRPGCSDCIYHKKSKGGCSHPAFRRKGRNEYGK